MKINVRIIILGFMTATLLLNSCKKNNTVETENIFETNQITEEIQTPETIEVQAEKEAFLALEGSSPAGRTELEKISRSFPDQAFFAEYPFLKEFF